MDTKTKEMIKGWLELHHGNVESLARWMRGSLKVAGIKQCRAMIAQAIS